MHRLLILLTLGLLGAGSAAAQERAALDTAEAQRLLEASVGTMRFHCTAPHAVGADLRVRIGRDGTFRVDVRTWPRADREAEACLDSAARRALVPSVVGPLPRAIRAEVRIPRPAPHPVMEQPYEGNPNARPGRLAPEFARITDALRDCQRAHAPSLRAEITVTVELDAAGRVSLSDVVLPPGLGEPALVSCARERVAQLALGAGPPDHLVAPVTLVRGR